MARSRLDFTALPLQHIPLAFGQVFSGFLKCLAGIDTKHETHPFAIPSIQLGRLCKVGVASKEDATKPCVATKLHRLVEIPCRPFVARSVTAAIDDEQCPLRVGQRYHQRMVAPLSLEVDVDSLFAFAGGFYHRSVGFDNGFLEERLGLLSPDFLSCFVEDIHQLVDRGPVEASTEVTGGSWIGNALRTEGIEVVFIVASQFQMFQARAAGQQVVRDIEDMVGLCVRQIKLQQLQSLIESVVESDSFYQLLHQADAAGCNGLCLVRDFIMNVARRDDGTLLSPSRPVQSPLHSSLACPQLTSYLGIHSKTLRVCKFGFDWLRPIRTKHRWFSSFLTHQHNSKRWLRLFRDWSE